MAIIGLDFGTELDAGRKTFGYVPHPWGMYSAVPIVHDRHVYHHVNLGRL
jgi:hypothetical protein